jgi:succinate dehydrogenase / fumarate reductase, cytochrome b subunit
MAHASPYPDSHPFVAWLASSIGKKTVVAATGIFLVLFVIGHLLGNLTIFFGPNAINSYAEHLLDLGPLLWLARVFLLACVVLHIYFTMRLWSENHAARPVKYIAANPVSTTIFARTMRLSGLIVLAFVLFHLAHFTLGLVYPQYAHLKDSLGRKDVFAMVVHGFEIAPVSIFYVVGLFFLTFHLSHGIGSLFQTLGLSNGPLRKSWETGSKTLAWLLFIGYSAIPVSILLFGYGKEAIK